MSGVALQRALYARLSGPTAGEVTLPDVQAAAIPIIDDAEGESHPYIQIGVMDETIEPVSGFRLRVYEVEIYIYDRNTQNDVSGFDKSHKIRDYIIGRLDRADEADPPMVVEGASGLIITHDGSSQRRERARENQATTELVTVMSFEVRFITAI